jgi:hypothetical protein
MYPYPVGAALTVSIIFLLAIIAIAVWDEI